MEIKIDTIRAPLYELTADMESHKYALKTAEKLTSRHRQNIDALIKTLKNLDSERFYMHREHQKIVLLLAEHGHWRAAKLIINLKKFKTSERDIL